MLDAATGAVRWSYVGRDSVANLNERFTGTASFDDTNFYVNGGQGFYAFRKE